MVARWAIASCPGRLTESHQRSAQHDRAEPDEQRGFSSSGNPMSSARSAHPRESAGGTCGGTGTRSSRRARPGRACPSPAEGRATAGRADDPARAGRSRHDLVPMAAAAPPVWLERDYAADLVWSGGRLPIRVDVTAGLPRPSARLAVRRKDRGHGDARHAAGAAAGAIPLTEARSGARMYTDEWRRLNGVWHTSRTGRRSERNPWRRRPPEAILLLHGLTQQSHVFDAVAARLTRRHRCVALDFRGRGESEWADGTYTIPQYVEDVLALLDALATRRGARRRHLAGRARRALPGEGRAASTPLPRAQRRRTGDRPARRRADRSVHGVGSRAVPGPRRRDVVGARAVPWLAGSRPTRHRRDPVGGPAGAGRGWRFKFDPAIGHAPGRHRRRRAPRAARGGPRSRPSMRGPRRSRLRERHPLARHRGGHGGATAASPSHRGRRRRPRPHPLGAERRPRPRRLLRRCGDEASRSSGRGTDAMIECASHGASPPHAGRPRRGSARAPDAAIVRAALAHRRRRPLGGGRRAQRRRPVRGDRADRRAREAFRGSRRSGPSSGTGASCSRARSRPGTPSGPGRPLHRAARLDAARRSRRPPARFRVRTPGRRRSASSWGQGAPHRLLIPRGVAHGLANLGTAPQAILYAVNRFFTADADRTDEWRLPWDQFGAEFWSMGRG